MVQHELPTAYELHVYELFKFVIDCLCNDHCVECLNDIIQYVPQRGYDLRSLGTRAQLPIA